MLLYTENHNTFAKIRRFKTWFQVLESEADIIKKAFIYANS